MAREQSHERALRRGLSRLNERARTVFSATCVERLWPQMRNGKTKRALRDLLDQLWVSIDTPTRKARWASSALDECMQLIPGEEDADWNSRTEDCGAALAYTLRCFSSGATPEALHSSKRVLDAIEHELSVRGDLDEDAPNDAWVDHPLVRAEIDRQLRDLEDLRRSTVSWADLRARASKEGASLVPPRARRPRKR